MHIETLKVFCDLVDLQSFSLAAERNFVTQSDVSQQIRTLEEKFKRRLLERVRGRREIKLTPAGEVFYRECKNVLAAYDQLNESLRGLVGKIGGTVKVATVYSVGLHEMPAKVGEFMSKFPSARIDLEYSRTTKVVRDVMNGTVELGVVVRGLDSAQHLRPALLDVLADGAQQLELLRRVLPEAAELAEREPGRARDVDRHPRRRGRGHRRRHLHVHRSAREHE